MDCAVFQVRIGLPETEDRSLWTGWLGRQDSQPPFRITNEALQTLSELAFRPLTATHEGPAHVPRKSHALPLATNLFRRNAVYYFRARIPLDLVAAFGRREVWQSLNTKEPKEARRRLPAVQAKFNADCEARRRSLSSMGTGGTTEAATLTSDDLRRYAQEFYGWELERDAFDRRNGDEGRQSTRAMLVEIGAPDLNEKLVRTGLAHGAEAGKVLVMDYADMICERDRLPRQGEAYDRLVQALLRSRVEAFARQRERDGGDFAGTPRDELLASPIKTHGTAAVAVADGERLETLCAEYAAQRRDATLEWQRAISAALAEFQDFFGAGRSLADVTKKDVAGYKVALLKVAAHAHRGKEKLSFTELVERGRREGEKGLANGSINRRLSALSRFGAWAVEHGHVDQNVFTGLMMAKKREKRRPFNVDQLKALFASALFVGCASADRGREGRPGSVLIDDWRFWCMPMALFAGARLGELLQLRVGDVETLNGVPCIHINDWSEAGGEVSGKRVKSAASARVVALHPCLIAMGFLEHVERQRRAGQARVFTGFKADKLGREATEPSKMLNRYLACIGIKKGSGLVFHSFRHTLIDGLRRAGHTDATIAAIVGHSSGDDLRITRGYGDEASVPTFGPRQKADIIASVRFGDLDMSHLHVAARRKRAHEDANTSITTEAQVVRAAGGGGPRLERLRKAVEPA
jgi:integrase